MSQVTRGSTGSGQDQAQPVEGGLSSSLKSALQAVAIFFVAQFAVSQFLGNKQAASNSSKQGSPPIPAFDDRPHPSSINDYNPVPQSIAPIWAENSTLDLRVYVSPSLSMPALTAVDLSSLVVSEDRFALGDWRENRDIDTSFVIPKEVQNNGTLWAHLYIALSGHILDPKEKGYDTSKAYHFFRPLSQYRAKKKIVKTKNLLSLAEEKGEEVAPPEEGPVTYASYYHPNFTLSFVPTSGVQTYTSMHPAIRQHVQLESSGARDQNGQNGWYYPILYTNTFWQLKDHMTELNDTVQTLPLHIKLNNLANWKFNIYASMDESVKQAQRNAASGTGMTAGGDGSEFEEFKRVLVDTNIYLLSTTAIVSVFHMIFEALAFKSDVSHWRQKKDNVGVSVRTILANVFMQSVIFLYLFDNSEGTSWMILVGQGMGILIEAWKITKTVNVRVRPADAGSLLPYKITFEDKHKLSATEKKTQEYDEIAFKYLYMVAVPLLLGYAVYSLVYDTHKSWYSFVLTTLVGSVYAYGFLMMVPSLYINYRLKSVAHMPARAMTYKFLNTFIDDLFAFTIKMPTLHRLATLRDDVIFFVYLYQSYAYKVDYTRVNEFGQGGDDEPVEEKAANTPTVAPAEANVRVAESVTGKQQGGGRKRK